MTNRQHVSIGVSILDADGQPFAALPDGAQLTFASDTPDVAGVTVQPDGMSADVSSGKVGTAIVTAAYTDAAGNSLSDSLAVAVQNSAPGSLNLTVGTPADE
jgi:hypothetical protein